MAYYRTRTYIAADWDGDFPAVEQLYKWNNSNYYNLNFSNAHDLIQSRDSSLNCTIKKSLAVRLNASKTFVLIVGEKTNLIKSGSCQYCPWYSSYFGGICRKGYSISYESYIDYECRKAVVDKMKIVVLYNSTRVNKTLCPEVVRTLGTHIPMKYVNKGITYWNYQKIKTAIL